MKYFKNRREQHKMIVVGEQITKAFKIVGFTPDWKNKPRWRQREKTLRGNI